MTARIHPHVRWHWFGAVMLASVHGVLSSVAVRAVDFDSQVAPILVAHCLECHHGSEPQGGLSLADPVAFRKGGDTGPAIVAGQSGDSLLWARVRDDEMPPKHPLSKQEKATLKQWIQAGADWDSGPLDWFSVTTPRRAGRDWWSLQPIAEVEPPRLESNWGRNAIDAFVLSRLQTAGLQPSMPADPRTLLRRLYFDLTGLPPTPEQVAAFESDPSEAAYQRVVDELLQSKHYGERWGRHWLDVVRFGESDGFERNFQRDNAWHYRDWVIRALNDDMAYDEFVRRQLVGDQLDAGTDGAAATGFWVAGVHNTTVGGSPRMKQLARQDEIEDVLATVGQAFLGLTFHCARCHDHKFDPVTQTEYYQLASSISGLGFGERTIPIPAAVAKLNRLDQQISELSQELAAINQAARDQVIAARQRSNTDGNSDTDPSVPQPPTAVARWEFDLDLSDSISGLPGTAHGNAFIQDGALVLDGQSYVASAPLAQTLSEKTLEAWVQLDDLQQRGGAAISIQQHNGDVFDAIVFGEREPMRWMAGSNGFVRTDAFGGAEETDAGQRPVHIAIVYQKDGTIVGYRDAKPYGHSYQKPPLPTFEPQTTEVLFGLRHKPAGGNRYLKGKVHRAALYDRALRADEIAASARSAELFSETQLVAVLDDSQRQHRENLKNQITALSSARREQAANTDLKVYTLVAGPAETTKVLLRGDPDNVGATVSPAATAAIDGLSADFGLAPDAPEVQRRRKLAEWITHENNPLFARVIVNRVWHYHMGTGIVDTPGDFGFNGGRPSHPELLDYLAWEFQRHGSRLKWLHRTIVSSSTYRQAVHGRSATDWQVAANQDADNRLLWRANARRLEAEAVRDAILWVSGKLNDDGGGPSFKDVSVTLNNGTTYYEPIAVNGPECLRRTVYRFNPRGGRSALLDTFDCPDPASTAPRRSVTTTPLQSLSLLNNPLVVQMADAFAQRVRTDTGDDVAQQITRAWQLAIARDPTPPQRRLAEQLVNQHGLAALCRGLFNLNEFVVID